MSRFDGHRVYNGCPDDTLQAKINEHARIRELIKKAGYTVTWFPYGEFYVGFKIGDNKVMTEDHKSLHGVAKELGIDIQKHQLELRSVKDD